MTPASAGGTFLSLSTEDHRTDERWVRRTTVLWEESDRLRESLERGRATDLDDAPTMTLERAEELLADVAASRRRMCSEDLPDV